MNQTRTDYGFEGLKIQVICASSHIPWLNEFLLPWLNLANLVTIRRTVILMEDDPLFGSLSAKFSDNNQSTPDIMGFLLDGSPVMLSMYHDQDGKTWLSDPHFKAFYQIDSGEIKIIVPTHYSESPFILVRVIRELAITKSLHDGSSVLHGAGVVFGNKGIVILGDRGAGKTSFSAYCMTRLGCHFIANDRVAVLNDRQGQMQIHGIPTLVRIRRPTLTLLPEVQWRRLSRPYSSRRPLKEALLLNEDYHGDIPEHTFLSPAQYYWLLKTQAISRMPLRLLLFPCLVSENQENNDQLHFERLSPQETYQLLESNSFSRWLSQEKKQAFCLEENKPPSVASITRYLQRISQEIPAYRCFLTPNVYQDRESLPRLLESL